MRRTALEVTPVLYMTDGTEYALAPVTIATAGVASVNVNQALREAPPEITLATTLVRQEGRASSIKLGTSDPTPSFSKSLSTVITCWSTDSRERLVMLAAFDLFLLMVLVAPGHVWDTSGAKSADLDRKMHAHVEKYTLVADNLAGALLKVGGEFKIPMGIEWVKTSLPEDKVHLSWRDATVEEIIRSILKHYPMYRFEEKNGTIHIYSPQLVPDRQNFLKLRIGEFKVQGKILSIAQHQFRDLVKASVSPSPPMVAGRISTGSAHSYGAEIGEPVVTIDLHDVSVEDILDNLALKSNVGIWVVTFRESGQVTPTGYRRTVSLENKFPIPDNEQPVWDAYQVEHAHPTEAPPNK